MSQRKSAFIFGLGYSASYAAEKLSKSGYAIAGTTRSLYKAEALKSRGFNSFIFNGAYTEQIAEQLQNADIILMSIAPDPAGAEPATAFGGDPVLSAFGETLKNLPKQPWLGYLSTVGVYGNHDGAWVDETTLCSPVSKRSIARLRAETAWQDLARQATVPLSLFRLSGIYGPERSPLLKVAKGEGRRINKVGQVFNRIHVEDIATAVALAAQQRATGLFNITDDEPAPPQDVVKLAAELLNVPVPPLIPFDECDLSAMGRSFYSENKRVSNQKSKDVLGMSYAVPNYRMGMKQALLDFQAAKQDG